MPTMITVPIGQRTKSIQFGAAYSPSLSFNPDKELLAGCSGILSGLGITVNTVPNPDQVTVDTGSFIQRGIIVDVASAQVVETPLVPVFPLYLVAENANEVHNSTVSYLFTTTPAADSVIIRQWTAGPITSPDATPIHISLCGLRDAIGEVSALVIQRERFVALGGQTIFTLPGAKAYVVGANKLRVFRNGKKLEESFDYSEDSPTQFTLNVPSIVGDILECIIYQGAPPITSLALLDLTDVTSDLANGIKDPTVLRVSPTDAANPLATLADIAAATAPLPAAVPFTTLATFLRTAGSFGVNTGGAFVDCPGPIEVAIVTTGGDVLVEVQATGTTVVSNPAVVGLGLKVDGVEQGTGGNGLVFGGAQGCGINQWWGDLGFSFLVTGLAAGAHTFRLTGVSSGFAGGLGTVYATPSEPLRMLVWYT